MLKTFLARTKMIFIDGFYDAQCTMEWTKTGGTVCKTQILLLSLQVLRVRFGFLCLVHSLVCVVNIVANLVVFFAIRLHRMCAIFINALSIMLFSTCIVLLFNTNTSSLSVFSTVRYC